MLLSLLKKNWDEKFVEKKKWGFKYNIYADHYMAIDICFVKEGGFSSWHVHQHQFNSFIVLLGKLTVTRQYNLENKRNIEIAIGPDESSRKTMVFPQHRHSFLAIKETIFIEVGTVKYSRDDIERFSEGGVINLINIKK